MKINLNKLSFILSFGCLILLFLDPHSNIFIELVGIHPLHIVLSLLVVTFFLGLLGAKDIDGLKATIRFAFTIIITITLSGIITYILIIGTLLS